MKGCLLDMCLILLVEDHKLMAEVLVNALHKKGNFKVADVAGTAEEALVDVVLPHTSGIDLVSIIQERYPHLPCLMVSGRSASDYVRRSLDAGARGYVLKDD